MNSSKALTAWNTAIPAPDMVRHPSARALASKTASLRVLEKSGFKPGPETGDENGTADGRPTLSLILEQPKWM